MKSLNILLINPPYEGIDFETVKRFKGATLQEPPIGLLCLMGRVVQMDCVSSVKILDFNLFDHSSYTTLTAYETSIKAKVKQYSNTLEGGIVGISLMFTTAYGFFEMLVNCIKQEIPDCTVVAGGNLATTLPDSILKQNAGVDYVVCGEGEEVFPQLIEKILNNKPIDIQGIHSRNNIKQLMDGSFETARSVRDIDFPSETYKNVDLNPYIQGRGFQILAKNVALTQKVYQLFCSRGCPVTCSFCAVSGVHGRQSRWRTLENIKEEIIYLHKNYDVSLFAVRDSNLHPKEKSMALFEMFEELNKEGISFNVTNMSLNHTDNEILDAMTRAGIKLVTFGLETGNKEMQKEIGKYANLDRAVSLVSYAKSKNMDVAFNYMLGFPGETVKQMQDTVDFALSIESHWSFFSVAVPIPGTPMYRQFVDLGYIESAPETWKTNMFKRTFDTAEISADDLNDFVYAANLQVNFVSNTYIKLRLYDKAEALFNGFVDRHPHHVFGWDCLRRIYHCTNRIEKASEISEVIKNLLADDPSAQDFNKFMYLLE